MLCRHALVFCDDDRAVSRSDIKSRDFAFHALRYERDFISTGCEMKVVKLEVARKNFLVRQTKCLEQNRDRHFAAAVNTEIQVVLWIKLKVQPRAAVRNYTGRKQQFARAVGFAFIVFEKHARRAVQLRDDDALSAIDNERAILSHERHFAHVNL